MRELSGRTVVVTGAAGGLGAALCRAFGAAGARVVALDRQQADIDALLADLSARGVATIGTACDVTDEAQCVAAIQFARQHFGGIDVLVNNAGITHRSALASTRTEVIRRVMSVNFFGALHCTHAALPDLIARRGQVVAISSVAGFAPLIARTGYSASKHALHGFFDSLRSEVEPLGVGVLLVCPSFIQTGIDRNALGGDGLPARHAQSIVGQRSMPDEIAAKIVHAARRDQRLLLPDRVSRTAWWVSRLAPGLYARLMARSLRHELRASR